MRTMRLELRIATTRPLPEPDVDEPLLLEALAARGIQARMAAWRDPLEAWDDPIPTLIRSPWDYIHHLPSFLQWVQRAQRACVLWNPAEVVLENAHKRYLVDLAEQGLPVVPTWCIAQNSTVDLERGWQQRAWSSIVIKPAVGAGSFATQRYRWEERSHAVQHLAELLPKVDVLVQPYLPSVEGHGERALVVIEGQLQHAVRKSPRFLGMEESVSEAVEIHADERELALRVLQRYPPLLYARVDVARDEQGNPQIMELELIEPSLFLRQNPRALARLADSVLERLRALG